MNISAKKALTLMQGSKGRFFTATFLKKDGSERTMNCQYLVDQDDIVLGYVKVKETSLAKKKVSCIRSVNLQTLKSLRINGNDYYIR